MRSGRSFGGALAAALVLASPVLADEIELRNGGHLTGVVLRQTADSVVLETSPGIVTLPKSRIVRIVPGRTSLETWRERAAVLSSRDLRGWAALARWAQEEGLTTQAREAWERVVEIDPRNSEAQRALGHVLQGGSWMSEDEAYRARGFVQADGRWMSPSEHEALIRARAEEDAARQQRMESAVRVREAEARAREAEARASMADTAAPPSDGIPVWWGAYGYGYDRAVPFVYPNDPYPYGGRNDPNWRADWALRYPTPAVRGDGRQHGPNHPRRSPSTRPSEPARPAPQPQPAGIAVPRVSPVPAPKH